MVLLPSTHVKTNVSLKERSSFIAIMSLFFTQKWKSNCDKKCRKWQVCAGLSTRVCYGTISTHQPLPLRGCGGHIHWVRPVWPINFGDLLTLCYFGAIKPSVWNVTKSSVIGTLSIARMSRKSKCEKTHKMTVLFRKKHWKCFFCLLHAIKRTHTQEPNTRQNTHKITVLFIKKALKMVLFLSIHIKTNVLKNGAIF